MKDLNNIINKIHCADSSVFLKEIPDNSIDIVLTSPPYNFDKDYATYEDRQDFDYYFNEFLFPILDECYRVLKEDGRMIINVMPAFKDYIPTHHLITKYLIDKGMIWKGEIIWEKNNYNCNYTTWGSWCSPSSPYLKTSWEFVEVMCKSDLKHYGEKENITIEPNEFKNWVYAKWSIAPEKGNTKYNHPAMFPEELVKRLLKLFSYKHDIVLDPFNGAGTTTKVSKVLLRRFIGIDISEEYCNIANDRLNNLLKKY